MPSTHSISEIILKELLAQTSDVMWATTDSGEMYASAQALILQDRGANLQNLRQGATLWTLKVGNDLYQVTSRPVAGLKGCAIHKAVCLTSPSTRFQLASKRLEAAFNLAS